MALIEARSWSHHGNLAAEFHFDPAEVHRPRRIRSDSPGQAERGKTRQAHRRPHGGDGGGRVEAAQREAQEVFSNGCSRVKAGIMERRRLWLSSTALGHAFFSADGTVLFVVVHQDAGGTMTGRPHLSFRVSR
ncbi:hypothetical protein [Lentzea californiensis]|uniref:hypothetical protein n=1 Tax=Lentzea californiensis TaxID=438851 RepID=UPI002166172E|nr:hypothetical protein [Lentzea californiensis]